MKYKSTNGTEFKNAFNAVQFALRAGLKVGIYDRSGNFKRWLV